MLSKAVQERTRRHTGRPGIRIDPITKARYHKRLADLVKGAKAPSANDEQEDPVAADGVYSAWSTYLRVNTRDTKKYSLLLQENINYGYRRNVWGLRPIGITRNKSGWKYCTVETPPPLSSMRGGSLRGSSGTESAMAIAQSRRLEPLAATGIFFRKRPHW